MNRKQNHLVAIVTIFLYSLPCPISAFVMVSSSSSLLRATQQKPIYVSNVNEPPSIEAQSSDGDDDDDMDDETLLKKTPKKQLVELCEQFGLSTKGTKTVMLQRLREYAQEQAENERQRLLKRRKTVEEGTGDEREKFEIVEDSVVDVGDDEEEEIFFYYESKVPDGDDDKKNAKDKKKKVSPKQVTSSQGFVTAPPPPDIEPDENGERVVTVYSTTEQNDLTGVAAAQPGQAASFDPLTSTTSDPIDAPWDTNNPRKADTTTSEMDSAKDAVKEVVQTLLAMTGLPGFQPDSEDMPSLRRSSYQSSMDFTEFDPANVPTELLEGASRNIRMGRGSVLRDVLREFELRAIGDDGTAIDNVERGGGHYRQVSKVRSFLEGFRRAEVRRLARETATLLLDKLVSEGIEGLDVSLGQMARSSDDTADEAGELNDSLLEYLDDTIRQQEKKVEQGIDTTGKIVEFEKAMTNEESQDEIENLWKVEDSEEGERIETFDPNDPENQKALAAEYKKATEDSSESAIRPIVPSSAPEKLLLLLKLLRERVKIEAAFSHDEKSRNLRVLAYCLQLRTDDLRKELIIKEFGASLDRLDSFEELVKSSIEYGESTSHQLQPSQNGSLNVPLLKRVAKIANEARKSQAFKASGTKGKLGP